MIEEAERIENPTSARGESNVWTLSHYLMEHPNLSNTVNLDLLNLLKITVDAMA